MSYCQTSLKPQQACILPFLQTIKNNIVYKGVDISLHNITNQQDKHIYNQLFGNIESEKSNDWQSDSIGLRNCLIWVVLLQLFPNWTARSPTYTKQYINAIILHYII